MIHLSYYLYDMKIQCVKTHAENLILVQYLVNMSNLSDQYTIESLIGLLSTYWVHDSFNSLTQQSKSMHINVVTINTNNIYQISHIRSIYQFSDKMH